MAGQRMAVFFDIGDTLASPVVTGGRLTALDVYPLVPEVLDRLAAHRGRVALGLLSNTGDETAASLRRLLAEAGLADHFDDDLLLFSSVEGLDKSDPAFFTLASTRAGLPPARCLFVGESEAERAVATTAGLAVSPHPLHALHAVDTELHAPG